ncbi:MAG: hypothetical protein Q4D16_00575 [Eubacteriales bacterium]|nr:hypothetical protein [Eubacteriales bacterium]
MKTVTVLLTKYSDWISTLVYYICGKGYTHASLSIDGGNTYYSFNYKGFCRETLDKHRKRGVKRSLSYQLKVSDQAFAEMEGIITSFQADREKFHYTRLGVLFCVLGIPFQRKWCYFCSQFVAEVLTKAGAVSLERPAALYLPNDFQRELQDSDQLESICTNPI